MTGNRQDTEQRVWTVRKAPGQMSIEEAVRVRRAEQARRRKARIRRRWILGVSAGALLALCGLLVWGAVSLFTRGGLPGREEPAPADVSIPSWIEPAILDLDGHARDGAPLGRVRDIAIHYVGNPDTTAMANRNYFNSPGVEVSSHFIVGLDGEIIQCLPLNEKSAATNHRNSDTISIEVCHPDETGQFNSQTYASLIKLAAWLCRELHLDETHLIRHYDVTGKLCPLYYVEHEEAWEQLKADVGQQIAADRAAG